MNVLAIASVITPKPASRDHVKPASLPTQNNIVCSAVWSFGASSLCSGLGILTLPGRRVPQRRDATGAPTQRPEWRGGVSRPREKSHSGGKAINPRGLGTESPSKIRPSTRQGGDFRCYE